MRVDLVTSFSSAGAELYGRRCVESVTANWPHPMTVYADEPMDLDGVTVRLTSDIHGWSETKASLPSMRSDAETSGRNQWTKKPTSYLWDAQRFAVKPYVWLDAAMRLDSGLLVWLDGDTVTTAKVPDEAAQMLMADVDVTYLGRGEMHPDTGFVAFRVPEALPLLRWCVDAYRLGGFAALVDGWTDCHVLREGLESLRVNARDLTSHAWNGEWRSGVDAFAMSPLGPYVQHLKGTHRKRELSLVWSAA